MPKSKLEKQKEAEERAKLRAKRGHKDQISSLDAKFGAGVGAQKERTRLLGLIEEASRPKKEAKKDVEKEAKEKPKRKKKKE